MVECKTIPAPSKLKNLYPLQAAQKIFLEKTRKEICQILEGKDPRRLLIVGPCSIHDLDAGKEYALKLKRLSEEVSDRFLLVMRTYFDKPRTILGWKGFLYDPGLDNSHNIEQGLHLTRQFLLDLNQLEIPTAAEFLEPASGAYFDDLIAWGCIGARTSASQTHRQMASGLPMPVAFKNTTDGNIEAAIHGIMCCAEPHNFIGIDQEGQSSILYTQGNRYGHLVLRGSDRETNYDPESVTHALKLLKNANLPLRLLIDCSHGNSKRRYEQQSQVFQSVIGQIIEGNSSIRGALLESHLNAGNQPLLSKSRSLKYGVSITDPCLDWSATENLIRWAHQKLTQGLSFKALCSKAIHADDFVLQNI